MIQYQDAYVNGLTRLCLIIAAYCTDKDLSQIDIEVGLKKPSQIAKSMIVQYSDISVAAATLVTNYIATLPSGTAAI